MQAIRTQYFGPRAVKGSRMRASCAAKAITIEYDDALTADANHAAACRALMVRLGWIHTMVAGQYKLDFYWVPAASQDVVVPTEKRP